MKDVRCLFNKSICVGAYSNWLLNLTWALVIKFLKKCTHIRQGNFRKLVKKKKTPKTISKNNTVTKTVLFLLITLIPSLNWALIWT